MSGSKIIEGLKQATAGGFARVTIDGQTWARSEWQPIETAPKNGATLLVWRPSEGEHYPAHVGVDLWSDKSWYRSRRYQQPTHWMPLPAPPALTETDPVAQGN